LKRFVYNSAGGVIKLSHHIQYDHELVIQSGQIKESIIRFFQKTQEHVVLEWLSASQKTTLPIDSRYYNLFAGKCVSD
jgi:hypothetical protein